MAKRYTIGEELANVASHGVGLLFGVIAGIILMKTAIASGNVWAIATVPLYIFGMLSSYLTSTWYHACKNDKRKAQLRKFDHAAIYLHIAGTYSPITLILLRETGMWGWGLFIFVWLAAAAGLILSFVNLKEHSHLETICFVSMGACILVAFKPMLDTLAPLGSIDMVYWLIGGGVSYIVGALFYSFRKVKYMHSVFHLFVLGGSVCHVMMIYILLINIVA